MSKSLYKVAVKAANISADSRHIDGWKLAGRHNRSGDKCICGDELNCFSQMRLSILSKDTKRCPLITLPKNKRTQLLRGKIFDIFGIAEDGREGYRSICIRPGHFHERLLLSQNEGPIAPIKGNNLDTNLKSREDLFFEKGYYHPIPSLPFSTQCQDKNGGF